MNNALSYATLIYHYIILYNMKGIQILYIGISNLIIF